MSATATVPLPAYAELQVTSNFSFLRGGSHPEELVARAEALGVRALALTDRNSLAGVVRAHVAAREAGLRFLPGARIDLRDGRSALCLPTDRPAYARLSRLLTLGKRRAPKGECHLDLPDLLGHAEGQVVIGVPPEATPDEGFVAFAAALREAAADRAYLAAHHLHRGDDARRIGELEALGRRLGLPLVATGDVHYHDPARRPLQDVVGCIRMGCTLAEAGTRLFANAERHLKAPAELARSFREHPDALARTLEIADACRFSLDELRYDYPEELVHPGETAQETLERLTSEGARGRYPDGLPDDVRARLAHELDLIRKLDYAPYFLTVHDVVRFARERNILCQGRGSAANSAVCFCLGITAVDPTRIDLLFERFISAARNEPPDIDVDFEHERREEVIQYIYGKYGREHAGLAATVISYRARSALREVAKVFGLSPDAITALASTVWGWGREGLGPKELAQSGLDPTDPTLARVIDLAQQLIGFPRHLSQHVGGFVISRSPLCELVPIENAAMAERTVVGWDKDDLDALGLIKVDVLALGMLTCIRKGLQLLERHHGRGLELATIPAEDPAVYDMICEADTVGVFQIESRAQMNMLPRLRPRRFYDLVIEVAIVRPGPIQGDMVHPYLRRRRGDEPVVYPSDELRQVLEKTLGVPLFQEQAMRIAIVAAGFTPNDADRLRRAMGKFSRNGTLGPFERAVIEGMVERGYERDFAERCFRQIEGFGTYGFPESHAASFALLVYASCWLKCHYPDVFCAAILNSQPLGFYAPAQLVRDAREHGIEVRAVDVNFSDWDCTLEPRAPNTAFAVRLGLRQIKGLNEADATRLVAARRAPFRNVAELQRLSGLGRGALERLARADAFGSLGLDRRRALWDVRALGDGPPPLFAFADGRFGPGANALPVELADEPLALLPAAPLGEQVVDDFAFLHLSLKAHPCALLRDELSRRRARPTAEVGDLHQGDAVHTAGLVMVRQRPGSAKGVVFITLEDETGIANVVVWPSLFERNRKPILGARLLGVRGRIQREGDIVHVMAEQLFDLNEVLDRLAERGEPVEAFARADEVRRPSVDARAVMPKGRNFR